MRRRFWTNPATAGRREIIRFVTRDGNAEKGRAYVEATTGLLRDFDPDRVLPHRPEPELLPNVYQDRVPGFAGYVLWVAATGEAVAVVAAFRPGLATGQKVRRARRGLDEL